MGADLGTGLLALYSALHSHFGYKPGWWPIISDRPQFEIIVGSVLVQRTRWAMVELTIAQLYATGMLEPAALATAPPAELAQMIRRCAFYDQKAAGLQQISRYLLTRYQGDTTALLTQNSEPLRAELLALPRIGKETADTIMLYAGGHARFIVDTYARRLFSRLDLLPGFDFQHAPYDTIQQLITAALIPQPLPAVAPHLDGSLRHFLWDLHALIVEACVHHCRARHPRHDQACAKRSYAGQGMCASHCQDCNGCPLRDMCALYALERSQTGTF